MSMNSLRFVAVAVISGGIAMVSTPRAMSQSLSDLIPALISDHQLIVASEADVSAAAERTRVLDRAGWHQVGE